MQEFGQIWGIRAVIHPGQQGVHTNVTKMGYFGVGPAVPARSAAELPALSGNHLLTAALAVLHLGQCLALPGMAKLIPSPTSNFTFVPPADFAVVRLLLADLCPSLPGQPAQEGRAGQWSGEGPRSRRLQVTQAKLPFLGWPLAMC